MDHKQKILWEIKKRGDEFLQNIAVALFYDDNKHAMTYGEHKEKDKGRDIIVYDDKRYYSEIIQVKHSKNDNNKFSRKKFLAELGKTLINLILDERELKQKHIDSSKGIKFSILLNYRHDKSIMDINSEIKSNVTKVAVEIFDCLEDNKRFSGLKYEDIESELIKILNVLVITIYDEDYLYFKILSKPELLFQFKDIPIEIEDLIDKDKSREIEEMCKQKGMKFLNELEKIDYDKFSLPYSYAIDDYSKAFSVFEKLNDSVNNIFDYRGWEEEYKKYIKRRYNEKKIQYLRKLKSNDLIETCQEFYEEVTVNIASPYCIAKVKGNLYVERGLYHLEIEEGNLKGWRLDE